MFNVSVNDKKNIYRSKPVMNVDTVPKPLTYDYMPEGYPSKSVGLVTLFEEQEVAFFEWAPGMMTTSGFTALEIEPGDKLTVVWDGISYDTVVATSSKWGLVFGNLGLLGDGETTNHPFLYFGQGSGDPIWLTYDPEASHTIKVMRQQATYTPMSKQFMPSDYPNEARVTEMINTALGVIENGSY